jgi:dTDP-4-amino-4,6-dideoxygalactose transaminase
VNVKGLAEREKNRMYLLESEEIEAARRVLESGRLYRYPESGVSESAAFEREWSEKIGCDYAIAMCSGTAALICGLVGMGIGPGDEIVVPAYTFMATPLAVLATGAVPVIADIDETLTVDVKDLERKISPATKAIIPVHMCGFQCNMDAVMEIAATHELMVLEDACQADGGTYKGTRLGAIGDAGAFSFNEFKIITCGEGGALVTNKREIFERAMIYHDGGCALWDHDLDLQVPLFAGVNFRIHEISSAILRVQLTRLDTILAALRKEKSIMKEQLTDGGDAFLFNPVHDEEGDCATNLALLFESQEGARLFARKVTEDGIKVRIPLDSGRHVYINWEPILERRGANHPLRDPFKFSGASFKYTSDMCPSALEILGRTVLVETSATRTENELQSIIESMRNALFS